MANINFNSAQIQKQAKQLEEAADKLTSGCVKKLDTANEALKAAWSGKAANTYIGYMKELNTNLASNISSAREIAAVLKEACKTMQAAEEQAKTKTASN